MNVGILGTGMVGVALGDKLVELGHSVTMGGREATNAKGEAWAAKYPERAHYGAFADAAAFGDLLINATSGTHSLEALEAAGEANLNGKTLIELANELDFSTGRAVSFASDERCLAERIQQRFPQARVVKSLNTISHTIMVDPSIIPGEHHIFLSGDDEGAKGEVRDLLKTFGWTDNMLIDLGGIVTARGPEMALPLWVYLWGKMGDTPFSFRVVKG